MPAGFGHGGFGSGGCSFGGGGGGGSFGGGGSSSPGRGWMAPYSAYYLQIPPTPPLPPGRSTLPYAVADGSTNRTNSSSYNYNSYYSSSSSSSHANPRELSRELSVRKHNSERILRGVRSSLNIAQGLPLTLPVGATVASRPWPATDTTNPASASACAAPSAADEPSPSPKEPQPRVQRRGSGFGAKGVGRAQPAGGGLGAKGGGHLFELDDAEAAAVSKAAEAARLPPPCVAPMGGKTAGWGYGDAATLAEVRRLFSELEEGEKTAKQKAREKKAKVPRFDEAPGAGALPGADLGVGLA